MKRSIAFLLSLLLVASMSGTAYATEATEAVSGNSKEVLASYEKGIQDRTVISVDISWEQMTFTYKGASEPTWNAEEHRYEGEAVEAGWAPGNGIIRISNNSNTVLKAQIGYKQETAYDKVFMSFTDEAPYIGSAYTDDAQDEEGNTVGTPCVVAIKAIPTGTLDEDTQDNSKIGTITIKVDSDVDVLMMLTDLEAKIGAYGTVDMTDPDRGTVHFVTGTDTQNLSLDVTNAMVACVDPNLTDPEKNVIINKLLTDFYGALDIVQ